MVQRHARQVLVIGLILLLGAQLTGLSCLEEWRNAFLAGSFVETPQITGVATAHEEIVDDGCPCHMAFVSMLSCASQPSHPVSLIEPGVPVTAPLVPPFLPFHPPLSL